MNLRTFFMFFTFTAILFFTLGCAEENKAAENEVETKTTETYSLNLVIPSIDGGSINLENYRGNVIILDFWATWCGPCRAEIPFFMELYKKYKDEGLVIIGAAIDNESKVKSFYNYNKMNYPVGIADTADAIPFGGVRAFPTTYIINKSGKVVKKYVGFRPKEVFEQDFLQLK